jgi:glycogen debranching enzyme
MIQKVRRTVTEGWSYEGGPLATTSSGGSVTLVEGVTFCISGGTGDIRPEGGQGLFFRDTRYLSQFRLEVDTLELDSLAVNRTAPYEGEFVARRPPRAGTADSTLLVIRKRYVGNGMLEEISVRNLGREATGVVLALHVEADFAGLFEVKEDRVAPRTGIEYSVDGSTMKMALRQGVDSREVALSATGDPVIASGQFRWQFAVPPHSDWQATIEVVPAVDGVEAPRRYRIGQPIETSQPATQLAAWRRSAPAVTTPDENLNRLLVSCAEDLGALRIFDPEMPERTVIAAGAPWFMTLFGRDSLLTGWMLLPLDPTLALGTLQTLGRLQGTKVDPLTEEEPGRILHEVRSGLDTGLALGGGNIYYGSIDATPLFVMLLGELRRWGVSPPEVSELLPHADRALSWIEQFGDRDGDGFIEYKRATDRGLVNQGWKDSFDGVTFANGAIAEAPIALCEVQGYAFAAFLARSHFAQEAGDMAAAREWAEKAEDLKRRFNEVFWLPERGYFALGLDAEKKPIDSLTSNVGHCLWTGIVDEDKAASVASHLLSTDMFTGFGVRTLSASMGAYNPMSYHNGSVWPHDTSIVAAGLMRYGFVRESQKLTTSLLDAAERLGGHLPELFCGFDRAEFSVPVPYPTSCSPQAWASASPLHLLRSMLRFDPAVSAGKLWCDPQVPDRYLPLQVERLHLAGAEVSVEVRSGGWDVKGVPDDIVILREGRAPSTASSSSQLSANRGVFEKKQA